jgi:hypothetical protein
VIFSSTNRRLGASASVIRVAGALFVAAGALWQTVEAQIAENEPPHTWGIALGIEGITARYKPRQGAAYAYATQGNGLAGKLAVMMDRHFLLGGELGVAVFGGDRRFDYDHPSWGPFSAQTTNSIFGSIYGGVITSPLGKSPRLGRKAWVGALAGAARWSGERRIIPDCPCGAPTLHMRSGGFVEPFVILGGGDSDGGGGFRLGYRHPLSGGSTLHEMLTLGVFFALAKI